MPRSVSFVLSSALLLSQLGCTCIAACGDCACEQPARCAGDGGCAVHRTQRQAQWAEAADPACPGGHRGTPATSKPQRNCVVDGLRPADYHGLTGTQMVPLKLSVEARMANLESSLGKPIYRASPCLRAAWACGRAYAGAVTVRARLSACTGVVIRAHICACVCVRVSKLMCTCVCVQLCVHLRACLLLSARACMLVCTGVGACEILASRSVSS